MLKIPKEVIHISEVLESAGFENYLIGGCVRDLLLGKSPKDWDLTTNATPEDIVTLFPHTFYENNFGTVGVVNDDAEDETLKVVEVTPFRSESDYEDNRHPKKVEWAKTLEEDVRRRDLTINALAYDIKNKKLIDLVGGEQDLKNKLIKTVGKPDERFGEDALRILRAIRLSSELNFAIEMETLSSIEKNKNLLENISKERIRDEFIKIVMSPAPSIALGLTTQLKMLKFISEEFERGVGVEQNKSHIYTVWEHLIRSLDYSAEKGYPLHVRLAALLHDIAKPHTKRMINGEWTFYGHEVVGSKIAKNILETLKFPREIVDKVTRLVRWHMFFSETETITLSAVRRVVRNVGPDLIWDLMDLRSSDRKGMGRPKDVTYRLRKYHSMIEEVLRDPVSVKQLKVNGESIMKLTNTKPGPHIGNILEILLSEVLEEPKKNEEKYLEEKVLELSKLKPTELKRLSDEAREKNKLEEEKEVQEIKEKYKVE